MDADEVCRDSGEKKFDKKLAIYEVHQFMKSTKSMPKTAHPTELSHFWMETPTRAGKRKQSSDIVSHL